MDAKLKYHTILKENRLSATQFRIRVLMEIDKANGPISRNELFQKLGKKTDRVTLYRNLQGFCEHNIIENVDPESGGYYTLKIGKDINDLHHLHFECIVCKKLYCIHEIVSDISKIPAGFNVDNFYLLAKGTCEACSTKSKT